MRDIVSMQIPERHGLTPEEQQQRLVEFRIGDIVAYRVMANTSGVVIAVCRRKFASRSRVLDTWIGQQLVKVRITSGCTLHDGDWLPANQFVLIDSATTSA